MKATSLDLTRSLLSEGKIISKEYVDHPSIAL